MEPIQITKMIIPQEMKSPKPGMYIYDFAQNFTGFCKLKVRGPRGTRVQLRFSELLYKDGTLNLATVREAKATDIYILKGEGEEIFIPHFTYHGFRYVELTGFPGVPTLETLIDHQPRYERLRRDRERTRQRIRRDSLAERPGRRTRALLGGTAARAARRRARSPPARRPAPGIRPSVTCRLRLRSPAGAIEHPAIRPCRPRS